MAVSRADIEVETLAAPPGLQRRTFLLGASFMLSGCALTPAAVDGITVAPGRGRLAMQLGSNQLANLAFNIHGKSTFASSLEDGFGGKGSVQFVSGERVIVIDVPVGEYMWTRLWTTGRQADVESTRFQVVAGAITYVGSLRLQLSSYAYQLHVVDQESQMRAHLQANYPVAMQSLPFRKELAQIRLKPV